MDPDPQPWFKDGSGSQPWFKGGSGTMVQRWIRIRNPGLTMDPDPQPWFKDGSGSATLV